MLLLKLEGGCGPIPIIPGNMAGWGKCWAGDPQEGGSSWEPFFVLELVTDALDLLG